MNELFEELLGKLESGELEKLYKAPPPITHEVREFLIYLISTYSVAIDTMVKEATILGNTGKGITTASAAGALEGVAADLLRLIWEHDHKTV